MAESDGLKNPRDDSALDRLSARVPAAAVAVLLAASLIRSEHGFHVWSESCVRASTEVISVREHIAADIATGWQPILIRMRSAK